jgi:hypothetical protein
MEVVVFEHHLELLPVVDARGLRLKQLNEALTDFLFATSSPGSSSCSCSTRW